MTAKEIASFNKTPRFIGVEIKNQKELPAKVFRNYTKAKRWADKRGAIRMIYTKRIIEAQYVHPDYRGDSSEEYYVLTSLCYCGGDDRIRAECEKPLFVGSPRWIKKWDKFIAKTQQEVGKQCSSAG
jgi:hypothetical protein